MSIFFRDYWLDIVGNFENITKIYDAMEAKHPELRRRYAEKSARLYAEEARSFFEGDLGWDFTEEAICDSLHWVSALQWEP
jgi:hypothetical protein